jgi:hypothetical protein
MGRNGRSKWTVLSLEPVRVLRYQDVYGNVCSRVYILGTTGGHMIVIQNANDFEFFSSNSKGAIQGNGYQCRNAGQV